MATVSEIITQAFVDLGVIQPGETISTTMRDAALLVLQQMYSGWSAEQVMGYNLVHQALTISAGTSQYTFGTGGTLVASARPIRVTSWSSVSGNFRNGGAVLPIDQFRELAKNPTARRSVLAEAVGADHGFANITLLVFPTPDTSPGTLELDYWTPLTGISAVTDSLTLPDGWEAALHFNLALALAPQYARPGGVPEALAANAQNSKALIVSRGAAILGIGGKAEAA